MDIKDVAEQAYKNGYEDGKQEKAKEIFQELYEKASSTVSGKLKLTRYQIEQLAERHGV